MKLISKWMPIVGPEGVASRVGWAMLLLVFWFSVESVFLFKNADAQMVFVGPAGGVRVRAPFVSVDVLPFHRGTRVRVPYATINAGFYRSYRPLPPVAGFFPLPVPYRFAVAAVPAYPVIAVPAYPAVVYPEIPSYEYPRVIYPDVEVARQPIDDDVISSSRPRLELPLPERLRTAAETLARTLSLREDGDVWLNYLGPQRIIENVDYGRPAAELQDLIINYDGVVSNGTLGSIQYARGFAASRDLLRQYLGTQESPAASNDEQVPVPSRVSPADPVPSSIVPTDSVPEPPAPQLPKNKPLKEVPVGPATAVEQLPVSDTSLRGKQIPRVTQAPKGDRLPRATEKVVQPTSL